MTEAGRSAHGRRPHAVVRALSALPLLCAAAACTAACGGDDDSGDGRPGVRSPIGCAEAMDFAGGTLPEGATDQDCSTESGIDTMVRGTFRMPGADAGPWLERAFPDALPVPEAVPCDADRCVETDRPGGEAHVVRVSVTDEGGGTALIRLEAFTR
ncbi:hypothetical protein V1L54_20505 [Streptomyces sp. TRM 70361]|uniref:hypothetical protein n=1 Tax=Streptomyces sp. TRM 70361 TaxID=3116553 RepID=UPI002E7BC1AE|nr:hypothetical protein [Streptomyces sp. TRM 70361]MEE1941754.1 hypothetical protein [Streptomyces sp. TRM 70361]